MSDPNSVVAPSNLNTPFATPTEALTYWQTVAIYALTGSLAVMIWDILDNVRADYMLLFKSPLSIVTWSYFGSRVGSLGYALASSIFETAPTGNCIHFETITDAWYPISLGCTGLLFFFRLRAIYDRNLVVVVCFFVLWLGLLASTMLIPIGILGGNVGDTRYCSDAEVLNEIYAALFAPLVYDTLVFIAITWRLAHNAHIDTTFREGFRVVVFGKYLPAFTRGLLLDGQRYYLISLISNLVVLIMYFNNSIPIPLRSMGITSNIVIINIMACRVFRSTRFGKYEEEILMRATPNGPSQKPTLPIQFNHRNGTTNISSAPVSEINLQDERISKIEALENRSLEDIESQMNEEK